jgi:hypothetical protein
MRANRSMPSSTIIPVLHYPDVPQAVVWLRRSFGTYRWPLRAAAFR